jgi:hypothetical protein
MFWQSFSAGLECLRHWEVALGALLYAAAVSAFVAWVQSTVQATEEGPKVRLGCFARALGGPLLQGLLVSALLVVLHPLLLRGEAPLVAGLASMAPAIVMAGIAAGMLAALLALLPVLGGMVKHSYAATLFVQGTLAFRLLVGSGAIAAGGGSAGIRVPGPTETLGYFVIAVVFGAALGMSAVLVRMQVGRHPVKTSDGRFQADVVRKEWLMTLVIMPLLQVLSGWAALMMYLQSAR